MTHWKRIALKNDAPGKLRDTSIELKKTRAVLSATRVTESLLTAEVQELLSTLKNSISDTHGPSRHSNAKEASKCIMNIRFVSLRLKKELEVRKMKKFTGSNKGTEMKYIVFPEDQALVPLYISQVLLKPFY